MTILTTLTLNDWFYISLFSSSGGFLGFCFCYAAFQLTQKYNRRKGRKEFDNLYHQDMEPMPIETPTTKCSDTLQQQGEALVRTINCELLSQFDGQQEYRFKIKGDWSQDAIYAATDIFRNNGWPIVKLEKALDLGLHIVNCKLVPVKKEEE